MTLADCLNQVAGNRRLKGLGARVYGRRPNSPINVIMLPNTSTTHEATRPGVRYLVFCYGISPYCVQQGTSSSKTELSFFGSLALGL